MLKPGDLARDSLKIFLILQKEQLKLVFESRTLGDMFFAKFGQALS
jgi:hypothetical protein